MNNIKLFLKGIVIGLANVIPGVSGGTLMITLGIYEKFIDCISHFLKNFKKNVLFLLPIGIGLVLSFLVFSKIINFSLDNYPFATTMFFIGLIVGGIPLLWNKVKLYKNKFSNWLVFIISFAFVISFAFLKTGDGSVFLDNLIFIDYIKLFGIGIIASLTMIIPGISGSFVLMLLGFYKPLIAIISNITDFTKLGYHISIIIPIGLGVVFGAVLISRIIEHLIKKYEVKTYFGVIGFVLGSMGAIIMPLGGFKPNFLEILCSIILFIIGSLAAFKLND